MKKCGRAIACIWICMLLACLAGCGAKARKAQTLTAEQRAQILAFAEDVNRETGLPLQLNTEDKFVLNVKGSVHFSSDDVNLHILPAARAEGNERRGYTVAVPSGELNFYAPCYLLGDYAIVFDSYDIKIPAAWRALLEPSGESVSLFAFMNDPRVDAFVQSFETDFPVSVSVHYQNVSGGYPYTVTDGETIRAVFDALKGMEVGDALGGAHTDDHLRYFFTMADNSKIAFTFQSGCYIGPGDTLYALSGFAALNAALQYPPDFQPPEVIRPFYRNDRLGFAVELYEDWEARDTESGAVELIPPENLAKDTTTNLIIEKIEGLTAQEAAEAAKAGATFGGFTKSQERVSISVGGGNGVTLEFEKPGEDGTVLWTKAQYMNNYVGDGCYLLYFTTIHTDDSHISFFSTRADNIILSFVILPVSNSA